MKRLFSLLLILVLATIVSGCSSDSTTGKDQNNELISALSSSEAEMKEALDDLEKAMDSLAVKGWPKDKLPPDLPEYTEGSIVNSGGSDTDFIVKIENTDEDALNRYLEKLESLNWNLT